MRSDTVLGEEEVDGVIFLLPNLTLRNAVDQKTVVRFVDSPLDLSEFLVFPS